MTDIQLVVSDLRMDASQWEDISAELGKAQASMSNNCELTYATFDGISHALGATAAYTAAFNQLYSYLKSGVEETSRIADRLRTTASTMENADYYG